jgi:hypothetical protein
MLYSPPRDHPTKSTSPVGFTLWQGSPCAAVRSRRRATSNLTPMSASGSAITSFSAWNSTIMKPTRRIGMIPMTVLAESKVESKMGAVAGGRWPSPRFPSPLIEPGPDFRSPALRLASPQGTRRGSEWQAFEAQQTEVPIDSVVREPAGTAPCHFVPSCEEVAHPLVRIAVNTAECGPARPVAKVVRPAAQSPVLSEVSSGIVVTRSKRYRGYQNKFSGSGESRRRHRVRRIGDSDKIATPQPSSRRNCDTGMPRGSQFCESLTLMHTPGRDL